MLSRRRTLLLSASLLAATCLNAQYLAGDYGSVVTGSWSVASTWKVYNGISWASSPAAIAPPGPYARAFVLSGTTVTTANQEVGDLFVETGGTVTGPSFVKINGSTLRCDGTFTSANAVTLLVGGTNVNLLGTGTCTLAAIVKADNTDALGGAQAISGITIGMNIDLNGTYSGVTLGNVATGTSTGGARFNIVVAAGITVSCTSLSSVVGIDCNQSGGGGSNQDGSLTVSGTLLIAGTFVHGTNNPATVPASQTTVTTGGYLRAQYINNYAPVNPPCIHTLNLQAGATLELNGGGAAAGTLLPWLTITATGVANVLCHPQSTIIYATTVPDQFQAVPSVGGYGNLTIRGQNSSQQLCSPVVDVNGNVSIESPFGELPSLQQLSCDTLKVAGNWTNYDETGFDNGYHTVVFDGAGTQTIYTSGTGERFYVMVLNKPTGADEVRMLSDVLIWNETGHTSARLWLNRGYLNLNVHQLIIPMPSNSPTRITTATAFGTNAYIRCEDVTGVARVVWTMNNTSGIRLVPFGTSTAYTPITFQNLSGSQAGDVGLRTFGTSTANLPWPMGVTSFGAPDMGPAAVDRFYGVYPSGPSPNATITFGYGTGELPAAPYNTPLALRARKWNGTIWGAQLAGSATANSVTATGTTFGGVYTLTADITTLPVELLSFEAAAENDRVRLDWATASEHDNDHFTILRSRDGIQFEKVTDVHGAGNSQEVITYSTYDDAPFHGLSYYKLLQTDIDGATHDHGIRTVILLPDDAPLVLYPNPASGMVNMRGLPAGTDRVVIADMNGRDVAVLPVTDPSMPLSIPLLNIKPGIYALTAFGGTEQRTSRLYVE